MNWTLARAEQATA